MTIPPIPNAWGVAVRAAHVHYANKKFAPSLLMLDIAISRASNRLQYRVAEDLFDHVFSARRRAENN